MDGFVIYFHAPPFASLITHLRLDTLRRDAGADHGGGEVSNSHPRVTVEGAPFLETGCAAGWDGSSGRS